jgi:hypothetical protein
MPVAQCSCGGLTATVDAYSPVVAACHCTACQRRSGSPFGVAAYFPVDAVTITGERREWTRSTDSGSTATTTFCPTCGGTVTLALGRRPDLIGIPVGTFADPAFPPPLRSVWEENKHIWVEITAPQHFPQGST